MTIKALHHIINLEINN